ncbi:MAG: IS4 family transposase [Lysobacterales bacterium]|nr:MAG: IS4 family transposase [Xanthomonadales bacterium]
MAGKKRNKIKSKDLNGFKYFKILSGLLEPLHDAACRRDRAHNRLLHMDQYITLLLMYMFNPVCCSLRAIQEAGDLKKVQRVLKVPRASLGSLSEAARIFDSDLLVGVIGQLVQRLEPVRHNAKLSDFDQIITLVDGTWLRAVPKMTWALFQDDRHKSIKAHVQLELLKGVPTAATVTDATTDEAAVLGEHLQAGRLYVLDRGYFNYVLYQAVLDADSSFVCRVRDNVVLREIIEERELSADALAAGVVRDVVAMLGHPKGKNNLTRPLRIVEVECTPHRKPSGKTGRGGPIAGEVIRIVTDRLDLPADVVGLIYKHRWQVEIFFRFFKHVLGCRHLLSHCENGIELETYAAIIACLLIALWTGRQPTLSTYRMLCWYFSGWADEDELLKHVAKLKRPSPPKPQPDGPIYI